MWTPQYNVNIIIRINRLLTCLLNMLLSRGTQALPRGKTDWILLLIVEAFCWQISWDWKFYWNNICFGWLSNRFSFTYCVEVWIGWRCQQTGLKPVCQSDLKRCYVFHFSNPIQLCAMFVTTPLLNNNSHYCHLKTMLLFFKSDYQEIVASVPDLFSAVFQTYLRTSLINYRNCICVCRCVSKAKLLYICLLVCFRKYIFSWMPYQTSLRQLFNQTSLETHFISVQLCLIQSFNDFLEVVRWAEYANRSSMGCDGKLPPLPNNAGTPDHDVFTSLYHMLLSVSCLLAAEYKNVINI